jgi:hypothetical protein
MKYTNNLQKIASDISGYGIEQSGAKQDFYYDECTDFESQIHYIQSYACVGEETKPITRLEAEKIRSFLNADYCCENDWYHHFMFL